MAHDDSSHESAVATYVTVAIVLAVITYLEFAIVEYDISWLSAGAILGALIVMSLTKFFFVIWWFMHLKNDEATYSGFFGSGMAIALGTFIVLGVLFIAPASLNRVRAQVGLLAPSSYADAGAYGAESEAGHGHGGVSDEELALISSDGYSRDLGVVLDTPRPKNQRTGIALPAAPGVSVPVAPAPALFGGDTSGAGAPAAAAASNAGSASTASSSSSSSASSASSASASEPTAQAAGPMDFDTALGTQTYANCQGCHQAEGQGIPSAFPPLADHLPDVIAADGGRTYVIHAVLYGLQGQIVVNGTTYNGVMPAWPQLTDAQIASVLNHELTSWGNADQLPDGFTPITADEVTAERGKGLSANDVHGQREALSLP